MNNSIPKTSSQVKLERHLRDALRAAPIIYIPHHDLLLFLDTLKRVLEKLGKKLERDCALFLYGVGQLSLVEKEKYLLASGIEQFQAFLEAMMINEFVSTNPAAKPLKKDIAIIVSPPLAGAEGRKQSSEKDSLMLNAFLQNFFALNEDTNRHVILFNPSNHGLSPEIEKLAYVIHIDPPSQEEIEETLDEVVNKRVVKSPTRKAISEKEREDRRKKSAETKKSISRDLQGLELSDIRLIARFLSISTTDAYKKQNIRIAQEKKREIVQKNSLLDVVTPRYKLDDIGGLATLSLYFREKAVFFRNTEEAMYEYHTPVPKGTLLLGMPGCGKSMIAQAAAAEFNVPLLKLEMNRILGQYVGESEKNFRKVLDLATAASPCVLWIDEIEKAFSGADGGANSGKSDVVMRLMGLFLTWMQEHDKAVYIIATANDVMRPEFMRKGRFDEIFYVGFPEMKEVADIFKKKIEDYNKLGGVIRFDVSGGDYDSLAQAATHFTGAEIDAIVNTAIEKKYLEIKKTSEISNSVKTSIDKNMLMTLISEYAGRKQAKPLEEYLLEKEKVGNNEVGLRNFALKWKDNPIINIYKLQEEHHLRNAK